MLFFDEIDSVLRTREGAVRSWEVSQVNEILARMEGFRGIFVAATNYLASLDPAVLRRFTFKLAFGYLDRADNARRRLAALREESDQKERLGAASFDGPERRPMGF